MPFNSASDAFQLHPDVRSYGPSTLIKGVANFYSGKKKHVITTQTDHKCVLDSCRWLQQRGLDVTYLPVKSNGLIDLEELRGAIRDDTAIVSVMAVNNEIGVVQPLKAIGELCRERKVFFHTDAAQAVGKIPIDVEDMKIDMLSISGHKVYGPKGVGAIYVRRRPRVRMEPLISGGGQERGLRSGTLPTPLVVGLGKACAVALEEMEHDRQHATRLSRRLIDGIRRVLLTLVPTRPRPRGERRSLRIFPGVCLHLSAHHPSLSIPTHLDAFQLRF